MRVTIQVKPNSKKGPLVEQTEAGLVVYIREPAVEGRANKAVIELLAKHFNVSKAKVVIAKGASGRVKFVDVELGQA